MNIFQLNTFDHRPFPTPDVSCDTIPNSNELLALLQLVIPGSDTLLPPDNSCNTLAYLSPGFMESLPQPLPDEYPGWQIPSEFLWEQTESLLQDKSKNKHLTSNKPRGVCEVAGCNTKKQSNGRCIRHGGGRRCLVEGCTRGAQTMGRCKRHGGGARCKVDGCTTSSQGGGLCRAHGGGKLCTAPGCKKGAQRQGKCATHASRRCCVDECSRVARCSGLCGRHKRQAESSAMAKQPLGPAKRVKPLSFYV